MLSRVRRGDRAVAAALLYKAVLLIFLKYITPPKGMKRNVQRMQPDPGPGHTAEPGELEIPPPEWIPPLGGIWCTYGGGRKVEG